MVTSDDTCLSTVIYINTRAYSNTVVSVINCKVCPQYNCHTIQACRGMGEDSHVVIFAYCIPGEEAPDC